jgi:hypothetical protein
MSDIDAAQLVQNIEKYGSAEGEPEAAPKEVVEVAPKEAVTTPSGYSFKTADELLKHQLEYTADGGKKIKEDIATILKRASQGYHYAQKMQAVGQTEKEWAEKVKAAQEASEKWGKFDAYAKENPQWYEHWQRAWEARANGVSPEAPQGTEPDAIEARVQALLEQKLAPIQQHYDSLKEQEQRKAILDEDKQFESEVTSIRKKYADIDFDATDPDSGKSLEYKVLEFGVQNNIKSFEKAFKAFYHDELVKREVERAKEGWTKEGQAQKKAGIIDIRSTPNAKGAPNLAGLNYEEITRLAAKELGIGGQ